MCLRYVALAHHVGVLMLLVYMCPCGIWVSFATTSVALQVPAGNFVRARGR